MDLCSFGRSFLSVSSRPASLRRVVLAFVAARRRWPHGHLSVGLSSVRWLVDSADLGLGAPCGLMVSWPSPVALDAFDRFCCDRVCGSRFHFLLWLLPSWRRGWNL
jgi:hypothetical protein